MRTNDEGIRQMLEADAFGHDTVVVVRDHKLWQKQMHLDTHFNIIDKDLCTMVSSRLNAQPADLEYNTCDIWARKPGTKEYTLWKQNLPFVEYMRGRGFQIIPIDYDDEMHYANNFLTIGPRHIMAVGGQSEVLQQRLRDAGVNVEWIPLENLIEGYGAAHCMTQVLQREANDGTPTSVRGVNAQATESQQAYRLNGTVVTDNDRGIIIQNDKKTVRIHDR
jgi:arginine deiminase